MPPLPPTPPAAPSSLTSKLRPLDLGGEAIGVRFLGQVAVFATGKGALVLAEEGEPRRIEAHRGAILSFAGDARRVLTGGDDGRVVATLGDGSSTLLAEQKGRWIDAVASGPDGAFAWSAGKTARFHPVKGEPKTLDLPSTVAGLAFAPKGTRLAVAHYNGVTLWFPNAVATPEFLEWKGSHRGVIWHPEGKFLVTTMQEPALHGWRLPEGAHMRMSGYPSRVRSMQFTAGGRYLATSGSTEVILWPFMSREGPMGKQPTMVGQRDLRVSAVACHPKEEIVACGYEDGMVLLIRITDGAEILLRAPAASPVTALAWRGDGGAVAMGTEDGKAGLVIL